MATSLLSALVIASFLGPIPVVTQTSTDHCLTCTADQFCFRGTQVLCINCHSACDGCTGPVECVACDAGNTLVGGVCTKCRDGRFGVNCNGTCHCLDDPACDHVTGTCTGKCQKGYKPPLCQEGTVASGEEQTTKLNIAALVGGLVAAVIIIGLVAGTLLFLKRRSKGTKAEGHNQQAAPIPGTAEGADQNSAGVHEIQDLQVQNDYERLRRQDVGVRSEYAGFTPYVNSGAGVANVSDLQVQNDYERLRRQDVGVRDEYAGFTPYGNYGADVANNSDLPVQNNYEQLRLQDVDVRSEYTGLSPYVNTGKEAA